MNSKCSSCGYEYKIEDAFCLRCGNKLSPSAHSNHKIAAENSLLFMSGLSDLMESISKMMSNPKSYEEKYIKSQGIDIEKYHERQKAVSLSPEETKGKSFVQIDTLRTEKGLAQSITDCKKMEKTLAVEFFQIVKPKFQTRFPNREKMIEQLNEYVVLRGKDVMSFASNIMNISDKLTDDSETAKFNTESLSASSR